MVEDRDYKFELDDKLLNLSEKDSLKVILVGKQDEIDYTFTESPQDIIGLVRKGFLGAQFKVTDIAWLYAIRFLDITFSELEKSKTVGKRIETNWSETVDNVKSHLRTAEQVNAYFYAMARALCELSAKGRFNDFGYAYGAAGLDADTLKKSNLLTLMYALENEKLAVDKILRIGNWPTQAVEMQKQNFKNDDVAFRKAVIQQMKAFV